MGFIVNYTVTQMGACLCQLTVFAYLKWKLLESVGHGSLREGNFIVWSQFAFGGFCRAGQNAHHGPLLYRGLLEELCLCSLP